jgi:hypothetical protein
MSQQLEDLPGNWKAANFKFFDPKSDTPRIHRVISLTPTRGRQANEPSGAERNALKQMSADCIFLVGAEIGGLLSEQTAPTNMLFL